MAGHARGGTKPRCSTSRRQSASRRCCSSLSWPLGLDVSVAQLPASELDEQILEIRGSVQIANAVRVRELREEWCSIAGVTERRLPRELEAISELPTALVRPVARLVAVDFDHFRLDVRGDQGAWVVAGDHFPAIDHGESRTQALGFVHEVRREQNSLALREQLSEPIPDQVPRLRIKAGRRLVEH